jgi:hypothetical protein
MTLTPQQADNLRRLLAYELQAAWHTAMDKGASPVDLADQLDERRRQMQDSSDDSFGDTSR